MRMVTFKRLVSANNHVIGELEQLGFYDEHLEEIEVYLVPVGYSYGWQYYGSSGAICIPAVSIVRLWELWQRCSLPLRDLLRHEYAHAVADTHRGLMRSRRFREAFDGAHESSKATKFDPCKHVTTYAATQPGEDFAEVFMYYVKHKGRLPKRFDTEPIRKRWQFVEDLRHAIAAGKRRW